MKHVLSILMIACIAIPALGDWDPGDPYKMHYPQLPDPYGWDVEIFRSPIADDWQCIESGPVTDIHFWISWAGDLIGRIDWLNVAIYEDVPVGIANYSHPGDLIAARTYDATQFTVRNYGTGDQGFYDPDGDWAPRDHLLFQQVNIVDKDPLFYQQRDKIYWLAISADWDGIQSPVGWKTTLDYFNDGAVYLTAAGGWAPLYDPALLQQGFEQTLELAFVITPEPASLLIMGFGGLMLLRKRR